MSLEAAGHGELSGQRHTKSVLVTGAAGFIGSNLVASLLEEGHRVLAADDLSGGKREVLPADAPNFDFVESDLRDREQVALLFRDHGSIDCVVHLAAEPSVAKSVHDPFETHRANLDAAMNVFDAAGEAGVKKVVFASTAAVYGLIVRVPSAETDLPSPRSPYAVDKLASEGYLRFFAEKYGFSGTVLRFFNVYGPNQDPASPYSGVISRFADHLRIGDAVTIFGDGLQTRDFVHVRDICAAIKHVLGVTEPFSVMNVGTGSSTSLLELLETMEAVFGRSVDRNFMPPRAGDLRDSCADIQALTSLGWSPKVRLREGLEITFQPDAISTAP